MYSFNRLTAPHSKVSNYYSCIVGAEEAHSGKVQALKGVKAVGDRVVEIKLAYAFPPFLFVLAGATAKVLPAYAKRNSKFFEKPVGSGPFRYLRREKSDLQTDVIFERFDDYYGTVPRIVELVLRATDEKTALAQASEGRIDDLANWPLTGSEPIFEKGQHIGAPVAATWIIGLNTRLAPFKERATRQFFRASVDSEGFRQKFHPDALPANGYIPPGLPGYEPNAKVAEKFSPTFGARTPITIAVPEVLAHAKEMKQTLESSFRSSGWNVTVKLMAWDELMRGYSEGSLQAFLVSMNMDYADTEFLVRNFESTNPDNFSGLKSKKVDSLIHRARATQDRVARQRIYTELVSKLRDEAITVDLFHPRGHYWVGKCVSGFEPNILSDTYIDYRSVSIDANCVRSRGGV